MIKVIKFQILYLFSNKMVIRAGTRKMLVRKALLETPSKVSHVLVRLIRDNSESFHLLNQVY